MEYGIENKKVNPSYNLSMLEELSMGDSAFVEKMIGIFIESSSHCLKQFNSLSRRGDIISIKKIAHQIKPSIQNMGIISIAQDLRTIENFKHKDYSIEKLKRHVANVTSVLSEVISQLKERELP